MLESFAIAVVVVWFMYLFFGKKQSERAKYYNGPKQTPQQEKEGIEWMTNHIMQFPNTSQELQKAYPEVARKVRAIRRYKELEQLRSTGQIDEATYNIELDKILPLIDISEDIAK